MRLRKEGTAIFTWVSWATRHKDDAPLDEVEKGAITVFTCVSWATHPHKNGAPLDEVEKGVISNF